MSLGSSTESRHSSGGSTDSGSPERNSVGGGSEEDEFVEIRKRGVKLTQKENEEGWELERLCRRTNTPAARIAGIVRAVAHHYNVPIACVALEAPEGIYLKARRGLIPNFVRKPSILQHTVNRALPLIIDDARHSTRVKDDMIVGNEPNVRFFAEAPLLISSSSERLGMDLLRQCSDIRLQWIGTLCIADSEPRWLSLNDTDPLVQAAKEISHIYTSLSDFQRDVYTQTCDADDECADSD